MSLMSKRAMRRERRRTAAMLRAAERELAELRAEMSALRTEYAERRRHWDSTLQFYRAKTEEARSRAANRLHGDIPVVRWPLSVSP